jgi:hypothetical protein
MVYKFNLVLSREDVDYFIKQNPGKVFIQMIMPAERQTKVRTRRLEVIMKEIQTHNEEVRLEHVYRSLTVKGIYCVGRKSFERDIVLLEKMGRLNKRTVHDSGLCTYVLKAVV